MAAILIWGGGFAIYGTVVFGYYLSTQIVSVLVTPRKHARLRNMESTEAYRSLRSDGYGITPDWSVDAIKRLKLQKK